MRVSLVQRLEILGITIHHDAADASKLPRAPDSVGSSTGYYRLAYMCMHTGLRLWTYVGRRIPCHQCLFFKSISMSQRIQKSARI